jgi:hypothetical protein
MTSTMLETPKAAVLVEVPLRPGSAFRDLIG